MTHPTPTTRRTITLHLYRNNDTSFGLIGEFAATLVPNPDSHMGGSYAITHALGSLAGGTHTEVAFVDGTCGRRDLDGDGSFRDPERDAIAEQIVRAVANALYAGTWAFHYRPEQVEESVLRYGSVLRERVEVSAVELWDEQ